MLWQKEEKPEKGRPGLFAGSSDSAFPEITLRTAPHNQGAKERLARCTKFRFALAKGSYEKSGKLRYLWYIEFGQRLFNANKYGELR